MTGMGRFGRRAALAAASVLAAPAVRAQGTQAGAWPQRPVRIVVPFPPGGSNDVVARPVAERLQQRLGQPVVIENRAGAGGAIGATAVSQAAPDGYTLMVSSSSFMTTSIAQRVPWTVLGDFTPVALLARARERPGAIDFGSSGPGGINHFVTEYFCLRAGIRMNHVPYRGMPPAVNDLVAGHIPVLITTMPSPEGAPPAPTVREQGIDYEADIWWGLFAPKGLPEPILARLNTEVNAALADPDMTRLFQAEGARPSRATPAEFTALLQAEHTRWREVAAAANIRPEG